VNWRLFPTVQAMGTKKPLKAVKLERLTRAGMEHPLRRQSG
jgi:hypothetical protein